MTSKGLSLFGSKPTTGVGKRPFFLAALGLSCALLPFGAKADTVRWTGAGQSSLWDNPLNWDGGFVPGENDDVVASGAAVSIRVVTDESAKSISLPPGSNLTVSTTDGALLVTGPAKLDGVSLYVSEGGSLSLPVMAGVSAQGLKDAGVSWNCNGAGSLLNVGGLTGLSGAAYPWRTEIYATDSGKVTLGGDFEIPGGELLLIASGPGSELNMTGLRRLSPDYVDMYARDGGKVSAPNLREFVGKPDGRGNPIFESTGAQSVLEVGGLTNFVGAPFPRYAVVTAGTGGKTVLKGDFEVKGGGLYIGVGGANSVVEAPGLRRLAPDYFTCNAQSGARLSLPDLAEWAGNAVSHENAYWTSGGAGSLIEMPALANLVGSDYPFISRFSAESGGKITMGGRFEALRGAISLVADGPNAVLDAPGLERLQPEWVSAGAYNGGHLALPHLHQFSPEEPAWGDINFTSDGEGSRLEWGELRKFEGSAGVWVSRLRAVNGGQFVIGGEFDIEGGVVSLGSYTGGEFSLPGLRHLAAEGGEAFAQNGGMLSLPNLAGFSAAACLNGFSIESDDPGSVLTVSGLTNFVGAAFPRYGVLSAKRGGHLVVNGDFGAGPGGVYFSAEDPDSLLEAPGLKLLAPTYFACNSQNGGRVALSGLREWRGSAVVRETPYWTSGGTNSLIDLPALTTLVGSPYPFVTRFDARDGGKVSLGGDFGILAGGVNLVAQGANSWVDAPGLKRLQPESWNAAAEGGGKLTLPNLREVSGLKNGWGTPTWRCAGDSSLLSMGVLAKFEGTTPNWSTSLQADAGGRLVMDGAFDIVGGTFYFYSNGAGSSLELPGLGTAAPGSMEISITGSSKLSAPRWRSFSGANALSGFNWGTSGAGSSLELPALTELKLPPTPYGMAITATAGAKALLPALPLIVGGSINLTADGDQSLLDLRSLSRLDNWPRGGYLRGLNGGKVILPAVCGVRGVYAEGLDAWGPPAVAFTYSSQEVLLGQPDEAARVEIRPVGAPDAPWQNFGRVALRTNQIALYRKFNVPPGSELRVSPLRADPPEVDTSHGPDGGVRLTVFGLPGKSYRVDASAEAAPAVWGKAGDLALTHPFGQIDFSPSSHHGFFRGVSQ